MRRSAERKDLFLYCGRTKQTRKVTTYHKCNGCGKYCKPVYIDGGDYILYLVSSCCKEKTKVIRYVYEKKGKGKKV
jgi:hypothetical protein